MLYYLFFSFPSLRFSFLHSSYSSIFSNSAPTNLGSRTAAVIEKDLAFLFFLSCFYLLFLLSYPPLNSSHSACKPLSFSFKYMRVQIVGGAVFIVLLSYSSSHTYIFYTIFFIFNLFDCLLILQIRYHRCKAHSVPHDEETGRVK